MSHESPEANANSIQQQNPPRLVLQAHAGSPVTVAQAESKKSIATVAILCSISFAIIGAIGGWLLKQSIDSQKQYQRYASELAPLIYYKDRVHSAKNRGSNTPMRIVNYKIYQAYQDGLDIPTLLEKAQPRDRQPPALAQLNERRFIDNLRLGIEYGIYEGEANLNALAYGKAPVITKGEFKGEQIQVEHIVPRAVAPDLDNILANLTWYPASLNQSKNDTITEEALEVAKVMQQEGILPVEQFNAVEKAFEEEADQ